MKRYTSYLKFDGDSSTLSQSQLSMMSQKGRPTPIIVICSPSNFRQIKNIFEKNGYFGLDKTYIKIVI